MLDSGSHSEDETLTIRFATLGKTKTFGQKYPTAHLDEIIFDEKIWSFFLYKTFQKSTIWLIRLTYLKLKQLLETKFIQF